MRIKRKTLTYADLRTPLVFGRQIVFLINVSSYLSEPIRTKETKKILNSLENSERSFSMNAWRKKSDVKHSGTGYTKSPNKSILIFTMLILKNTCPAIPISICCISELLRLYLCSFDLSGLTVVWGLCTALWKYKRELSELPMTWLLFGITASK